MEKVEQVKLIKGYHIDNVEQEINDFLLEDSIVNIIEIQHSHFREHDEIAYLVMIRYVERVF